LPAYYIDCKEALALGWNPRKGDLAQKCPQNMIFGGEYKNVNGHLPVKSGRIWYEADINYTIGFRGPNRILFSNDGLVFVTYDYYLTFCEII